MHHVITGLEQFVTDTPHDLAGARIGLLTNPTGIDRQLRSAIDLIAQREELQLVSLFGPEHGIRGEVQAGAHVDAEIDSITGLPIHSLYGDTRVPTAAMLEGIDALVIDLQDIGVRYATYLSTVDNVMTACNEHNVQVVVLDRPNPLGGATVVGGLLRGNYRSFIGTHTLPVLHGLTIGEFARLLAGDRSLAEPLIIPMTGWDRSMFWDDTDLPWVLPSPNLPTLDSHLVYAGTCLIEGTNLSEGRGTTRPFETIGAPWIDPDRLATALRQLDLPGVGFRPVYFVPMFSKHAGTRCGGVQVYIQDRAAANTVELGVHLLRTLLELDSDHFAWLEPPKAGSRYFIDLLAGGDQVRHLIDAGENPVALFSQWQQESESFRQRRSDILLYDSTRSN